MNTKIWENNRWMNITPQDTVNSTRRLHSFCVCNGISDSIMKSQGGYYLLTSEGILKFVGRSLNSISFETVYNFIIKEKCKVQEK